MRLDIQIFDYINDNDIKKFVKDSIITKGKTKQEQELLLKISKKNRNYRYNSLRKISENTISKIVRNDKGGDETLTYETLFTVYFGSLHASNRSNKTRVLTLSLIDILHFISHDRIYEGKTRFYVTTQVANELKRCCSVIDKNKKNNFKSLAVKNIETSYTPKLKKTKDILTASIKAWNDMVTKYIGLEHLIFTYDETYSNYILKDINSIQIIDLSDLCIFANSLLKTTEVDGSGLNPKTYNTDSIDYKIALHTQECIKSFIDFFSTKIQDTELSSKIEEAARLAYQKKYGTEALLYCYPNSPSVMDKELKDRIILRKNNIKLTKEQLSYLKSLKKNKMKVLSQLVDDISTIKDSDSEVLSKTITSLKYIKRNAMFLTTYGDGYQIKYSISDLLDVLKNGDALIDSKYNNLIMTLGNTIDVTNEELKDEHYNSVRDIKDKSIREHSNRKYEEYLDSMYLEWMNASNNYNYVQKKDYKQILRNNSPEKNGVLKFNSYIYSSNGDLLGFNSSDAKQILRPEELEKYGIISIDDITEADIVTSSKSYKTGFNDKAKYVLIKSCVLNGKNKRGLYVIEASKLKVEDRDKVLASFMSDDYIKGLSDFNNNKYRSYKNYVKSRIKDEYTPYRLNSNKVYGPNGELITKEIEITLNKSNTGKNKFIQFKRNIPFFVTTGLSHQNPNKMVTKNDEAMLVYKDMIILYGKKYLPGDPGYEAARFLKKREEARVKKQTKYYDENGYKKSVIEKTRGIANFKSKASKYIIQCQKEAAQALVNKHNPDAVSSFDDYFDRELESLIGLIRNENNTLNGLEGLSKTERMFDFMSIKNPLNARSLKIPKPKQVNVNIPDIETKPISSAFSGTFINADLQSKSIAQLTVEKPHWGGYLQGVDISEYSNFQQDDGDYLEVLTKRELRALIKDESRLEKNNYQPDFTETELRKAFIRGAKQKSQPLLPMFYVKVQTPPPKIRQDFLVNEFYGCIYIAIIFYLYVSNTPIDEEYEYEIYIPESDEIKIGRVARFKYITQANGKQKRVEKTKEELKESALASVRLNHTDGHWEKGLHTIDEDCVRGDWVIEFRGKKFKAFETVNKVGGIPFSEELFDYRHKSGQALDIDGMINNRSEQILEIAKIIYESTYQTNTGVKYDEKGNKIFDKDSLKYNIYNVNKRWDQLEYGGYNPPKFTYKEPRVGSKYGLRHGTNNGFTYQAPNGFIAVTNEYINSFLNTKKGNPKYITTFINRFVNSEFRKGKMAWDTYSKRYIYPKFWDITKDEQDLEKMVRQVSGKNAGFVTV